MRKYVLIGMTTERPFPVDNFGTVVGESPDRLLLSGTVVGENPDHVCWFCIHLDRTIQRHYEKNMQ